MAPSADNRHCFKFQPSGTAIGLYGGEDYVHAPFHRRVLNRISLGAVVENMVIRAHRLGYDADPVWHPDPTDPALVAEVRLTPGAVRDSGLDAAIATRHTNRRVLFAGPRLSDEALATIISSISDIPGVRLTFCDAGPQRATLLRLVRLAETERFRVRELHSDLFSAVRFDVGWRSSAPEGLPPVALGVEPGMRWAFAQLRHWPLMRVLGLFGLHHVLGLRAAWLPCRLAPHLGVLTVDSPLEPGTISVGRALQRVWLTAEKEGLAFQPLAGAALLALAGYYAVRTVTQERLGAGWSTLTTSTPLMVFRLGVADPVNGRAGRPPLNCLVA